MFRLSRLESAAQEIIFILTLVASLSLLAGGGFYLFMNEATLPVMTGSLGTWFFALLFEKIGLAALLLGLGFFLIGNYLIPRTANFKDIWRMTPNIVLQVLIQILVLVMLASFMSVVENYNQWQINSKMSFGIGGWLGTLLGGNLFKYFGLYGAISFIFSFSIVVGIAAGYIELLSLILWLEEKSKFAAKFLFKKAIWSIKASYVFTKWSFNQSRKYVRDYYQLHYRRRVDVTSYLKNPINDEIELKIDVDEPLAKNVVDQTGFNVESFALDLKREFAETEVSEPVQDMKSAVKAEFKINETKPKKRKKSEEAPKVSAKKDTAKKDTGEDNDKEEASKINEPEKVSIKKWTKKYTRPEAALLEKVSENPALSKNEVIQLSKFLEERLESFQIKGQVVEAHVGVSLTMFEFQPAPGMKLSKISGLADDLALVLGADSIRIMTPIPGKTTVGIEVPNKKATPLLLGDLLNGINKAKSKNPLPIALGKNVYNDTVISDISEMPHMLVCGTTGSGKSVFINTLITSLLYTRSPKELRFLMIDPKMIELSPYNGIPHLLKPVITDVTEAKDMLKWAEAEMDRRYQMFAELQTRNITSFNENIKNLTKESAQRRAGKKFSWEWMAMPYIVVVVDEMADLMLTQGREVEIPITRIAQKARAAGIHLVLATQRPSAEIVTGLIKTNFPTRISFKVSSSIDSRTVLDSSGAEKLLGKGDMLFMANGKNIERIQGAFVSEDEVKKVVRSVSK